MNRVPGVMKKETIRKIAQDSVLPVIRVIRAQTPPPPFVFQYPIPKDSADLTVDRIKSGGGSTRKRHE